MLIAVDVIATEVGFSTNQMNFEAGRRARGRMMCLHSVVSIPGLAAVLVDADQADIPALSSLSR